MFPCLHPDRLEIHRCVGHFADRIVPAHRDLIAFIAIVIHADDGAVATYYSYVGHMRREVMP